MEVIAGVGWKVAGCLLLEEDETGWLLLGECCLVCLLACFCIDGETVMEVEVEVMMDTGWR